MPVHSVHGEETWVKDADAFSRWWKDASAFCKWCRRGWRMQTHSVLWMWMKDAGALGRCCRLELIQMKLYKIALFSKQGKPRLPVPHDINIWLFSDCRKPRTFMKTFPHKFSDSGAAAEMSIWEWVSTPYISSQVIQISRLDCVCYSPWNLSLSMVLDAFPYKCWTLCYGHQIIVSASYQDQPSHFANRVQHTLLLLLRDASWTAEKWRSRRYRHAQIRSFSTLDCGDECFKVLTPWPEMVYCIPDLWGKWTLSLKFLSVVHHSKRSHWIPSCSFFGIASQHGQTPSLLVLLSQAEITFFIILP